MKKFNAIVIGFGKAGKTLAVDLAKQGQRVLLIEKNSFYYGGTCINVGCIPTKKLLEEAKKRPQDLDKLEYYKKVKQKQMLLRQAMNQANYNKLIQSGVEVLEGEAKFVDPHTLEVSGQLYQAETIFINTGARPRLPQIKGLKWSDRILNSEGVLALQELPKKLLILGGGFISLEFATMFKEFGAEVEVLEAHHRLLPKEDEDLAVAIQKNLENQGVVFRLGVQVQEVEEDSRVKVKGKDADQKVFETESDILLVAAGRIPNTEYLDLEKANLQVNERGAIPVNAFLQTKVEHIYALGDVNGGPQFTYISLDDYRIVKGHLSGDKTYDLTQRPAIPFSVFLNPVFSRIGMTEQELKAQNIPYKVAQLSVSMMPKAKILEQNEGFYKVMVHTETEEILGAVLFAPDSHEVINLLSLAMQQKLSYQKIKNQIFTHPSMSESLNDVFAILG